MRTGQLNISYEVKRELRFIKLRENLYAYQLTETVLDEIILQEEGFTNNILISNHEKIKRLGNIAIAKREILDINLHYPDGFHAYDKKDEILVENPYTFLLNNENYETEYMLIDIFYYSGDLKDIDTGKYYPKGIHIEYIKTPQITSYYYDLPKVLEYLKTKSNVILLSDKVLRVPYYNQTEESKEYLEFMYIPTPEEYAELVEMRSFNKGERCLNSLGLGQFSIDHSNDEMEDEKYDY